MDVTSQYQARGSEQNDSKSRKVYTKIIVHLFYIYIYLPCVPTL